MVEKNLEAVRLAIESAYEYFITWEDSSTQNYSPMQYDEYIGSEMGIIGGIEPTHFLGLTESELGLYVESVIDEARGGPFILANSDSCPPGVTVEKFKLVADIARACRP